MHGSVSTPGHHWPAVPLEGDIFEALPRFGKQCFDRFWSCDVDGTDHMRLTGSDDQRYRVTLAECSVDALQWNGAHIGRRQVIDSA